MKKTLVLIPALNPPKQLIDYVKSLLDNNLKDILLVDDGSKEEFKEIFETIEKFPDANIKVFRHAKNFGKGRALKNAFNYFLTLPNLDEYNGVVTADSDGQHKVEDVIKLAKEVEENPDTLILGCRDFDLEQVPPKSKFGNKITNGAFKLFYGKNISDTQTGLRGFPTAIIKEFLDILSFKWILALLLAFGNIEGAAVITIATVIARIISSTFNFYLNKKFVFEYEKNTKESLLKYYSLCAVQMLISAFFVTLVWKHTKYPETSIKIVVDSILFLLSYFIQQRWVFKRK